MKLLRRLTLFCFGLGLALFFGSHGSVAQTAASKLLPLPPGAQPVSPQLVDCVPGLKDYPDRYVFLSTGDGDTSFYTIGVNRYDREASEAEGDARTPPPEKRYWEVTVALNAKGECRVVLGRNQPFKSLQEFMSRDAARRLALQRVQQYVEADHGIKKLQESIDSVSEAQRFLNRNRPAGAPVYESATYAPEMIWALKQVGVKVPDNIPVYPEPKDPAETPATDNNSPSSPSSPTSP